MAQYHFIAGDGKTYGPYSREQMQQFMAENRVNAQTQVSADGAAWQIAGQYPELASGGAPPVPATLPPMPGPGMPQPIMATNPAAAAEMVKGPAIFMMVLAIAWLILAPLGVLAMGVKGAAIQGVGMNQEAEDFYMTLLGGRIVQYGIFFVVNIFILIGAIKMKKCQSYGLAMAASILCILCNWSCLCLGLGAGIWAIVVLSKPEVKAAFH